MTAESPCNHPTSEWIRAQARVVQEALAADVRQGPGHHWPVDAHAAEDRHPSGGHLPQGEVGAGRCGRRPAHRHWRARPGGCSARGVSAGTREARASAEQPMFTTSAPILKLWRPAKVAASGTEGWRLAPPTPRSDADARSDDAVDITNIVTTADISLQYSRHHLAATLRDAGVYIRSGRLPDGARSRSLECRRDACDRTDLIVHQDQHHELT